MRSAIRSIASVWPLLALYAFLLIILLVFLAGCRAKPAATAESAARTVAAIDRTAEKAQRLEATIGALSSDNLVEQKPVAMEQVRDVRSGLAEANAAAVETERGARRDAATIKDLEGPSVVTRLRSWSVWFIVAGVGLAIGGWFLRAATPLPLELAPFIVGGGILLNWLTIWWAQALLGLLVLGAIAWFIWSPLPNLWKRKVLS